MTNRELLCLWIDEISDRAIIKKQLMKFSNNYDISLLTNKNGEITGIDIKKKENIYKRYFGPNVDNVNVIVGINGIGKTTILELLGSSRVMRKSKARKWKFFALYKIESHYILEGCTQSVINNFVENKTNYVSDEYNYLCSYDAQKQKLVINSIIQNVNERNYFATYFDRDNSNIKSCISFSDDTIKEDDWPTGIKRNAIMPKKAYWYKYITQNEIQKRLNINFVDNSDWLKISVIDGCNIDWESFDKCDITGREQFILLLLFMMNSHVSSGYQNIETLFEKKDKSIIWKEKDYEISKKILLENYNLNCKNKKNFADLMKVIQILEEIPFCLEDKKDICFSHDNSVYFYLAFEKKRLPKSSTLLYVNPNNFDKKLFDVLHEIMKHEDKNGEVIQISFRALSDGQRKALDILSAISDAEEKDGTVDNKDTIHKKIVLLDEPDKCMHPELARGLLSDLLSTLNSFKTHNRYEIIITTHSPFILSDLPSHNIHCLKYSKNREVVIDQNQQVYGLMSSIPDLMKNVFFLKSPIGEYAEKYFKKLQNDIKEINRNTDDETIILLKKRIDDVKDEALKKYLLIKLDEKIRLEERAKLEFMSKREKIAYYKRKIEELETND